MEYATVVHGQGKDPAIVEEYDEIIDQKIKEAMAEEDIYCFIDANTNDNDSLIVTASNPVYNSAMNECEDTEETYCSVDDIDTCN